jgi:hypothetical protein
MPYRPLDWTGFDVDEDDVVYASHIDIIQRNVDLIKDNLAHITHDSSVLSSEHTDHYNDENISEESTHKSRVYSTNYVDHRSSVKDSHLTSHLTSHNRLQKSDVDSSEHTSYYSDKDSSADLSNLIGRHVDHNSGVLDSHLSKALYDHNTGRDLDHYTTAQMHYCYPGRCRIYYAEVYDSGG